ncbi:Competence protein CoiA-like family protein [Cyclobacterium xiamenense]|uniref:Competence protein CoiA-like family protein n=1 Tax=Cyclobacterium xiamenense TaxID=1297121 RepID=A0A1H6ZSM3_9BACT|nr:competence protein CoiA family protein [Cyclobacterium xiamenense]SEJ56351.1 Competence protein CoiA-like family protein [Cyclobacterium xiamenense]
MRFALIDNKRVEAQPKQQGICPICSQSVIAKCGDKKVWHWAHRSIKACDSWWEPETEWHRNWKNYYPSDWQETVLFDGQTGEKHIADVKTIHSLVIEFQHSAIKPEERISREKFYKNMIWVVDGTRLKRDYPRFHKGMENFRRTNQQGVFYVNFPEGVFSKIWLNSSVPVIFDFSTTEQNEIRNTLWCLLPQKDITQAIVVGFKRNDLVQITHNRGQLFMESQKQKTPPRPAQIKIKRRESTHYLHKGKWVKRKRF